MVWYHVLIICGVVKHNAGQIRAHQTRRSGCNSRPISAGVALQGSPHLQKTGRLKAWQGDFQQLHRDMFQEKCCFFASFKKKLHLKCAFANILLISFIFNFELMFCTCIIVVDLIFDDFWYYSFRIEICKIFITLKFEFPPFVSIKMPPCLKLDKLIVYLWKSYK